MKKQRDYTVYLNDMIDGTIKGIDFIGKMSYKDFLEDEKTQFSVRRAIEIIGEGGKKFRKTFEINIWKFPGER